MKNIKEDGLLPKKIAIIIGAGPAGLSAAYHLLKNSPDITPIIIEELDCPGGLSRTICFNENLTDIGGHRLYTKNKKIMNLIKIFLPIQGFGAIDDKILGRPVTTVPHGLDPCEIDNVLLIRKRFSRIYYNKKFFDYPIKLNLKNIIKLNIITTLQIGFSVLKSVFFKKPETNLENFFINRFGYKLYEMFFKDYTEKVWGEKPDKISKQWGQERIRELSLIKMLKNIFKKQNAVSLIEEYYYPKYGCGQLWDLIAAEIIRLGGQINYSSKVIGINNQDKTVESVSIKNGNDNNEIKCDFVISSMPIKDLVLSFKNKAREDILEASRQLPYRDYIFVGILLKDIKLKNDNKYKTINNICPDSWIYINDKNLKIGRLMIVNNWSPYMVKNFQSEVLLGLEYFCNKTDSIWSMPDKDITDMALSELIKAGITDKHSAIDSFCLRTEKAYPAYSGGYNKFDIIKEYLKSFNNLYCIGRNGKHKYNNMDQSISNGMAVADAIIKNISPEESWDSDFEQEYNEEIITNK